ncbi:MAG: hypothetical protein ACREAA_19140 [Candidatus Polarisedimenticolia bacterium]
MRTRRLAAFVALLLAGASLSPAMATTEEFKLPAPPAGDRPSVRPPEFTPVCTGDAHACLHMARALRPRDKDRRVAKPKVTTVKKAPPTVTTRTGTVVKHGNGSNPEPVANP